MYMNYNIRSDSFNLINFQEDNINNHYIDRRFSTNENTFDPLNLHFNEQNEQIEINPFNIKNLEKLEIESTNNMEKIISSNSLNNNNTKLFRINKEKEEINKIIYSNGLKKANNFTTIKSYKKDEEKKLKIFINRKSLRAEQEKKIYRKDYYYKHFKAIFGKYLRNKINDLKNKSFPNFVYNNFSTPNYSFIGNTKESDNYNFLFWPIKEILVYKDINNSNGNRQNNNRLLIEYILKNEKKSKDKEAYHELMFLIINLKLKFKNFIKMK